MLIQSTSNELLSSLKNTEKRLKYELKPELSYKFRNELYVFSGFKTHAQLKEASELLLDAKGNIKDFKTFYNDVKKIDDKYNKRYLEVERNNAIAATQNAAAWKNFEKLKDTHDLEYVAVKDKRTRDDHARLSGTIASYDDDFWNKYMPPLDWQCRCSTRVRVKGAKESALPIEEAMKVGEKATTYINKDGVNKGAMFRYNAGKEEMLFPETHEYYKVPSSVKAQIKEDVFAAKTNTDAEWIAKEVFGTKKADFKKASAEQSNIVNKALKFALDKAFTNIKEFNIVEKNELGTTEFFANKETRKIEIPISFLANMKDVNVLNLLLETTFKSWLKTT